MTTKNRTIGDILFQGANTESLTSNGTSATWDIGKRPGTIIITFDSTIRSGYVELNGATISGGAATYPIVASLYSWMVSGGNIILPDARGLFLRQQAEGSGYDPDRASRTARAGDGQTGDYPGTYQGHEILSHTHNYRYITEGGTQFDGSPNNRYWYQDTTWAYAGTPGGNETRPININVTYQMRMG